jgi:nucleoside-diphosphate-sugar epimerase
VFHRGSDGCRPRDGHIHGNRLELESFAAGFAKFSPEVVVDLIAGSAPAARRTLRLFANAGRRLIFAGSQEVYRAWAVFEGLESGALGPGTLEPVPLTEASPLRSTPACAPATPDEPMSGGHWTAEGYDKLAMERAVRAWPGDSATILRLAPVFGPGDRQHRLAPLVRRMQDGRGIILLPRGWAEWRSARAYVENVAHGLALAVEQPRSSGRTYNLSGRSGCSGLEWAQAIVQAFGWRGRLVVVSPQSAPPHLRVRHRTAQHCEASTARIRAELGYCEPVAFEPAVAAAVAWEMRQPVDAAERRRLDRDYASEDAVLSAMGVATGAPVRGYKTAKAANSSATTTNTQTLPSGPTVPPVIHVEP